jgi:DNA-nicking Smr family endonuclease
MAHEIPIEAVLDLHTFSPRDIPSVVEEYVDAAHEAGLREIRLIHGRGKGIQRGIVQRALDRHPLVVEFWDAPESHLGATVARLDDRP